MNKKVLFCATVDYHFKAFHLPYIKWFKEQGWIVDVAASGNIHLPYIDQKYNILIKRSPLHRDNLTAYKQLKHIIKDNDYAIVHCHTPLGGLLARLAAQSVRKKGTSVIYTAHGFHFYKGASIFNWLFYYPIEKYLSKRTDCLITINQEDYELANKHRFQTKNIAYIPGVGIDTETFKPVNEREKAQLKLAAGYKSDDLLLFNAGEFNQNKNQIFLIQSMVQIVKKSPNVKLLLAGEGKLQEKCHELIDRLGLNNHVTLLGFRKDIDKIIQMSDISVAASFREGLPVNVMESMACGLPVVAVNNRGHRDLVQHEINGYLLEKWDEIKFANKVNVLANETLRIELGKNGRKMIINKYSIKQILLIKSKLYQNYMERAGDIEWVAP